MTHLSAIEDNGTVIYEKRGGPEERSRESRIGNKSLFTNKIDFALGLPSGPWYGSCSIILAEDGSNGVRRR